MWWGVAGRRDSKEDTLRVDGCVHYLDCGDDFLGIYICQDLLNCAL